MKITLNRLQLLCALVFIATPALADDTEAFIGVWGTEKQCTKSLISPSGTKRAAPFEITSDWLNHDGIWCRLNWSSVGSGQDSLYAINRSICGEDDARNYHIKFDLNGDQLTIVWDFWHVNGPLMRCKN